MNTSSIRTRWAAVGAAVAVSLGAGGIGISQATTSSGERPVYIPIEPCRLDDNRPGGIGEDSSITLSGWGAVGDCVLPSDTTALALNVTAVGATQQTNLRFYPADSAVPETANLNPTPGAPPIPNAVNVDLDDTGEFKVYNRFGTVSTVIDVMGYYDDHNHDDRYAPISQDTEGAIDSDDPILRVLTTTDETLATVTVDTPTSGYVILNASAAIFGFGIDSQVRCSITTGTTVDLDALQIVDVDANEWDSIGGTRGYQINKAFVIGVDPGETTYNYVCDSPGGVPTISDIQFNAIFVDDPDAFGFIIIDL